MLLNIVLSFLYPFLVLAMFSMSEIFGNIQNNVTNAVVCLIVLLMATYIKALLLKLMSKKSINHNRLLFSAFLQLVAGFVASVGLTKLINNDDLPPLVAGVSIAIIAGTIM